MIKFTQNTEKDFIRLLQDKKIGLEGNILKVIETDNQDFKEYIKDCIDKDKSTRQKRLELTKKIQNQNSELKNWKEENEEVQEKLRMALTETEISMKELEESKNTSENLRKQAEEAKTEAEELKKLAEKSKEEAINAKNKALDDLDVFQKKTQFELISVIVKVALSIIVGVSITTTLLYVFVLWMGLDTQLISSTWSNLFGILLTNCFSIIGTIMGIKYATEKSD
jgi:Fe2+ transport system protein B